MKTLAAICIVALLGGCATATKTVTGPGYEYTETIKAIGGSNIDKATQTFGGTLEVYGEDGSLLIKATLDSAQEAEGVLSDAEAIRALLGRMSTP